MLRIPRHAYVHVPFCRHRCGYCDFTLLAGRDDLIDRYFAALARELRRVPQPLDLDTLYLGGGTPSHLRPDGLRRLFQLLATKLMPSHDAEVTVEANPLDVTAEFVAVARHCGVTRVSLGGQSLDAATLRALDRDHAPADVRAAVTRLLEAGLVVNLDLMTAAPGQTLPQVEADLAAAVGLGVQHVSVYCLTWEPGTAFAAARRRGDLRPAEDAVEQVMFETAIDRSTASAPSRSNTPCICTAATPSVPSRSPRLPSIWKPERNVFCTAYRLRSRSVVDCTDTPTSAHAAAIAWGTAAGDSAATAAASTRANA